MVNALAFKKIEDDISFVELPDDVVKWCTVSLNEIKKANMRLEASVFDVESKQILELLRYSIYKTKPIIGCNNAFATAYRPDIRKRIFVKNDDGIPMFTPSQIIEIYPKAEKLLSKKMLPVINNWFVKHGELLLTCSGTVGKITLVTKTLNEKCVSQNLIRIVAKGTDIGFLYAFLNSTVGQILLTRNNYGAVIQHIDPDHLSKINVPNPPDSIKEKIHELIIRSFELRDESNELINKATTLLVDELQLPPIGQFKTKKFSNKAETNNYSVKLSDVSGRFDASYHVPIVNTIIEHIKRYSDKVTIIGENRISKEIILPGRFKRIYVEKGQGQTFFSGKSILELDPSDKKYLSFARHETRIKEQLTIRHNMILVTCSGTIGNVVLVPLHWDKWTMTHDIIRLVPDIKIAGYLYIWLQSTYAKTLMQAMAYGSVVPHIEKIHIEKIPVPLLKNQSIQTKINNLALEANKKRYEAYILEQNAMKILNDEVIYTKRI